MPELPHISGAEIVQVFNRLGFFVARQRGSHVVLRKGEKGCVVPMHREVATGTLRNAIKQAGITPEEFLKEYNGE